MVSMLYIADKRPNTLSAKDTVKRVRESWGIYEAQSPRCVATVEFLQ